MIDRGLKTSRDRNDTYISLYINSDDHSSPYTVNNEINV